MCENCQPLKFRAEAAEQRNRELGARYGVMLKDGNEHFGIGGIALYVPVIAPKPKCPTCGGDPDWTGTADDGIACPTCGTGATEEKEPKA